MAAVAVEATTTAARLALQKAVLAAMAAVVKVVGIPSTADFTTAGPVVQTLAVAAVALAVLLVL